MDLIKGEMNRNSTDFWNPTLNLHFIVAFLFCESTWCIFIYNHFQSPGQFFSYHSKFKTILMSIAYNLYNKKGCEMP